VKLYPAIRSIDLHTSGKKMLVGTKGSDIVEVDVGSGKLLNTII